MTNTTLLINLGSLYFWLVEEEAGWLDWLIGNEIIHTRLNLQRESNERRADSKTRANCK